MSIILVKRLDFFWVKRYIKFSLFIIIIFIIIVITMLIMIVFYYVYKRLQQFLTRLTGLRKSLVTVNVYFMYCLCFHALYLCVCVPACVCACMCAGNNITLCT